MQKNALNKIKAVLQLLFVLASKMMGSREIKQRVIVLFLHFNPILTQKLINRLYLALEFLPIFSVEIQTNYKSKSYL